MKNVEPTLTAMYENDPWVREFMINCFKIYGAPPAVVACVNHNEEVYHTFCAISLLLAMREQKDDWSRLRSEEPNDAAYAFAKIYFEKRGEHLIPAISYSDDYTEGGEYNDA